MVAKIKLIFLSIQVMPLQLLNPLYNLLVKARILKKLDNVLLTISVKVMR